MAMIGLIVVGNDTSNRKSQVMILVVKEVKNIKNY